MLAAERLGMTFLPDLQFLKELPDVGAAGSLGQVPVVHHGGVLKRQSDRQGGHFPVGSTDAGSQLFGEYRAGSGQVGVVSGAERLERLPAQQMAILATQPLLVLGFVTGQLGEHLLTLRVLGVVGGDGVELDSGLLGKDGFLQAGGELLSGLWRITS